MMILNLGISSVGPRGGSLDCDCSPEKFISQQGRLMRSMFPEHNFMKLKEETRIFIMQSITIYGVGTLQCGC